MGSGMLCHDYIESNFNIEETSKVQELAFIPCFLTRNGNAQGLFNTETEELTVLKGSKINPEFLPSLNQAARVKRDEIMKKYTELQGTDVVLSRDILFDSPSGAAKFCIGGSADEWESWKDNEGKKIKKYRKK